MEPKTRAKSCGNLLFSIELTRPIFTAAYRPETAAGGAIAGGVCALIGIALSCALQDVPAPVLLFGTLGSAVAGMLGALAARAVLPGGASGQSAS